MKRSLLNQKVTLKDALISDEEQLLPMEPIRDSNVLASIALMAIGAVMGMALLATIRFCDREPEPVAASMQCTKCHNKEMQMAQYFERNGSKTPEEMANAVLKTRSPRLLAAMAVVESNGNPHLRGTGYKKRYSGAWQTDPMWGKVTSNVTEQALIAEFALDTHVKEENGVIKGLNAYGGESNKARGKYAYNVLTKLTEVP